MNALKWTMIFCSLVFGGVLFAQKREDQAQERLSRVKIPPTDQMLSKQTPHSPAAMNKTFSDTARLEWVKHFSSNNAPAVDIATDVATDAGGCAYVTGYSESPDAGRDYLTIKYNPLGQELWRARYDGPSHADDVPSALVIDPTGNVCVTGMSMGPSIYYSLTLTYYDYATVKYSPSGQELWVARYSGPDNMSDAAVAIAVDVQGNVYVTGESEHADSIQYGRLGNPDFATIKYSPDGVQEWAARFNGPDNDQETATGLTVDASGNVFVTGTSCAHSDSTEVVTLKYSTGGSEQWVQRMAIDSTGFTRVVGAVADNSGNAYIAGYAGHEYRTSIFLAKYDAEGRRSWVRPYVNPSGLDNIAVSLAMDHSGNVLIAGVGPTYDWLHFGQGVPVLILKYDGAGNLLWEREYTDPINPQEVHFKVSDLAVDRLNNVYITGSCGRHSSAIPFMTDSIFTLEYDANGTAQWARWYGGAPTSRNVGSAVAVDSAGNVVVAGGTGTPNTSKFVTMKYQLSGNREWESQASGEGCSFESLSDMVLDPVGNVYVTGSSLDANTLYDYITAKLNPEGELIWKVVYDGPANHDDRSNAIVLDRLGNVYVTGSSEGVGTSKDWATIKYSASGVVQWVARYNGQNNQDDEGQLITVDSALNVYVAGATASGSRLTTTKYDPSGLQQWTASYDSTNFVAMPGGLCVDRDGNVYVTNPMWYWADAVAFKYNNLGVEVWRVFGGNDIVVDDSGNVYVTGWGYVTGRTAKYASSGAPIWNVYVGGSHLEFDPYGDILIHSSMPSCSGMITRDGALQWNRRDSHIDVAFGFCLDDAGNSYVSGISYDWLTTGTYTMKTSPTGATEWTAAFPNPDNVLFRPLSCHVDASGNLYVAGSAERNDFSSAAIVVKYSQITVPVREEPPTLPGSYSLSQNYPNPFNPSTTIRFSLPVGTLHATSLRVYDVLGREVATLVNEELRPGNHTVRFDGTNLATGVYYYRLESGSFTDTKKLMLLK